jgi:hypothetical protein
MGQERSEHEAQKRVRVYDDDHARINSRRIGDETQADVVRRLLDDSASPPGRFEAEAEISVSVPDEDLEAIREDVARAVDDATGSDLGPVTLDASERKAIAREVAEVLRE